MKFIFIKSFFKKIRVIESLMMTPFFIIGFIFTLPRFNLFLILQILLLAIHFYCFIQSVYLLNSYFGRKSDILNSRFNGITLDDRRTQNFFFFASLILFGTTILTDIFFSLHGKVFLIFNYVFWILYASPLINFKSNYIMGSLIHFFSGILNFLLGFAVASEINWNVILISIYFSLLFVSGHMHHMGIDFEADKKAGMKTLSNIIGLKRTSQWSIFILILATIHYIILAFNSIVLFRSLIPVFFAAILHLFVYFYFKSKLFQFEMRIKYRRVYRIVHALSLSIIALIYLYEGLL